MTTTYARPLSPDERALMTHVTMWGSDGYPVRKLGRRWTWSYRSLEAPVLYKTKREAVAAFETFLGVLRDCLAAEAMATVSLELEPWMVCDLGAFVVQHIQAGRIEVRRVDLPSVDAFAEKAQRHLSGFPGMEDDARAWGRLRESVAQA